VARVTERCADASASRCISELEATSTGAKTFMVRMRQLLEAASDPGDPPSDPLTFEAFFAEERNRLLRALYLLTGNTQEAEEMMQDAFLEVWERWERISAMDSPVGYLFRTALNRHRSGVRRALRAARRVVRSADGGDDFARADERDALARALTHLPARQRAAIVLTELLGYEAKAAAAMLGVRDVTVRSLASRARAGLRKELEENDG
jgi:RNA polymerase sigma factor (sigma-70 family)